MSNEMVLTQDNQLSMDCQDNPAILAKRLSNYNQIIKVVKDFVKQELKEEVHFGHITGVKNKVLFKAGAEALVNLFNCYLVPEIQDKIIMESHVFFMLKSTVISKATNHIMGVGYGSCSSQEMKYKYRWIECAEPPDYERKKALGTHKKKKDYNGNWKCYERIENDNLIDLNNTLLKMAEKRSTVNAVIKAFGISLEFTQDLDDNLEHANGNKNNPKANTKPQDKQTEKSTGNNISDKQGYVIEKIYGDLEGQAFKQLIAGLFGLNSVHELSVGQASQLIKNKAEYLGE